MKDIKNVVTTICGLIIAICGALLGVATQVTLPSWLITTCIISMAVATAILGFFSGRNPDGSSKTPTQLSRY
jgi:VIT1/CCC1 family predicted Fe2+/Mn2+ transporter